MKNLTTIPLFFRAWGSLQVSIFLFLISILIGGEQLWAQRGTRFVEQKEVNTSAADQITGLFDSNMPPPERLSGDLALNFEYGINHRFAVGIQGWSVFVASLFDAIDPQGGLAFPIIGKLRYRFYSNNKIRSVLNTYLGYNKNGEASSTFFLGISTFTLQMNRRLRLHGSVFDLEWGNNVPGFSFDIGFFGGSLGMTYKLLDKLNVNVYALIPLLGSVDLSMVTTDISIQTNSVYAVTMINVIADILINDTLIVSGGVITFPLGQSYSPIINLGLLF